MPDDENLPAAQSTDIGKSMDEVYEDSIIELAREHKSAAVETLTELLDKNVENPVRRAAANDLIDLGRRSPKRAKTAGELRDGAIRSGGFTINIIRFSKDEEPRLVQDVSEAMDQLGRAQGIEADED